MTASEAKSMADSKMAVIIEVNKIYTKIQDRIHECANRGEYKTLVYIDSDSYDAIRRSVEILQDDEGFECCLEYKSGRAAIEVSWENA